MPKGRKTTWSFCSRWKGWQSPLAALQPCAKAASSFAPARSMPCAAVTAPGKSTFLKILMGIFNRDAGSIRRRGKDVEFASPADALASGIAIIEQELSPVPHMTVAENIYLGREPKARFGGIDFRAMNRSAQRLLDDLEFDIRATQYMMNLSVAQMQARRDCQGAQSRRRGHLHG